jgi:hypothetical protein
LLGLPLLSMAFAIFTFGALASFLTLGVGIDSNSGRDPRLDHVKALIRKLDPEGAERLQDIHLQSLLSSGIDGFQQLLTGRILAPLSQFERTSLALDLMILRNTPIEALPPLPSPAEASVTTVVKGVQTEPAANLETPVLIRIEPDPPLLPPAQIKFTSGKRFLNGGQKGDIQEIIWKSNGKEAYFQIKTRMQPAGPRRGALLKTYRLDQQGLIDSGGAILTTEGMDKLHNEIRENFTAVDRNQEWTNNYPWLTPEAKSKQPRPKRGSRTKLEDIFEAFRLGLEKEFSGLTIPISLKTEHILSYVDSMDPREFAIYRAYRTVTRSKVDKFGLPAGFPAGKKAAIEATREYFRKNPDKLLAALQRQAA